MADFSSMFRYFGDLGVMDSLLPFFLIFIIAFAIFEKTKVLGENKRNMNIAIAFILGMAVIAPHLFPVPGAPDVVNIINSALPQVSVVVVAIVAVFLLIGLFAPDIHWPGGAISGLIVIAAVGIVIYIFGNSANWWNSPQTLGWFGPETQAFILIIIVFAGLVLFITSPGADGNTGQGLGNLLQGVGNMFRRGGGH